MNHPLHIKAINLAKQFKRVESELIEVLEQIDSSRLFRRVGYSSLFDYATKCLGFTESVAYGFITVSRKAKQVPELKSAIQSGMVSVSQAKRVVSVITKENAEDLIQKVQTFTQKQIEKEVAKIQPQTLTRESSRYVTESRVEVKLGASEEFMKKLKRVQDLMSQKRRTHANMEMALEEALDLYLEKHDPVRKADRILKNSKTAQRIQKLSLRRVISSQTKHKVFIRDRGQCTYIQPDGARCNQTRWTEIHHLQPRELGGGDEMDNLTTLCSSHHKAMHEVLKDC